MQVRRGVWFVYFFGTLFSVGLNSAALAKADVLRKHMIQNIVDSVPESEQVIWSVDSVRSLVKTQKPDGTFPDIDYSVHGQASWWPLDQIGRALILIKATVLPKNPFYRNQEVLKHALLAIHYWATHIPEPHYNWWSNEIGLPLSTYKILLLVPHQLSEVDRNALLEATLKGHLTTHPSQFPATGENLIWFSEITIALGILNQKPEWIQLAVEALKNEFSLGHPEGIQEDGSFFQHGEVFYNGGYGINYAADAAAMMKILSNTPDALTSENYSVLSNYILDGQLWLVHRKTFEQSSLGRTYARKGSSDSSVLLPSCAVMAKVSGPRQNEFAQCEQSLRSHSYTGKPGNKHFWKSDFMTDNHMDYSISVKMDSNRTYNSDASPMGEGLRSEFLSDGVTYFYQSGQEYQDIFPLYDFFRLPGVTEEHLEHYPAVPGNNFHNTYGPTSFVGGVSDGVTGFSTMQFVRENLSANKTWFFHSGGMLALGSAIECDTCTSPILTSINQEWSRTPVEYGTIRDHREWSLADQTSPLQKSEVTGDAWVYANQKGYLIYGDHPLVVQEGTQSGSWHVLADALSDAPVVGRVFSLWIEQNFAPHSDQYVYGVYPGITKDALVRLSENPDFEILENSYYRQAVYFPREHLIQGAFYWAGQISWDQGRSQVDVTVPCVVQMRKVRGIGHDRILLSVASPTQKAETVTVKWNWSGFSQGTQTLLFPTGQDAGKTVTIEVK